MHQVSDIVGVEKSISVTDVAQQTSELDGTTMEDNQLTISFQNNDTLRQVIVTDVITDPPNLFQVDEAKL